EHYYNVWQDETNPRGLWRRATPESYRKPEPEWEVLLDIDALNAEEGENWVWHGATYLEPDEGQPYERVLVALSRGGADADVVREFDLITKSFVQDGFFKPEAKGHVAWIDRDRVYVSTDFGPDTMTSSGYPRFVKEWTRGTPMEYASVVYEGRPDDMMVVAGRDQAKGYERDYVVRLINFYSKEMYVRNDDGTLTKIDAPDSAEQEFHRDWYTVTLRDPWTVGGRTYPAGALLAAPFSSFMAGDRDLEVLFEPDDHSSLVAASWTKNHLLLNVLRDVKNEITVLTPTAGGWERRPLEGAPEMGTVVAGPADPDHTDEYFMTATDFITPSSLLHGTIGGGAPEVLKRLPEFFDADGIEVTQHFVASDDGTEIPYFVVGPNDRASRAPLPTLLHGYGGFEIPMIPQYMTTVGRGWLERGGVYVDANIRGGGEYGPRWHQAALREKRYRAYEDFAAVAKDVVARGITTHDRLACLGGSNGGLLVGNMLTMYPELFAAIVCQVPLLDMRRYHTLLAGASWMAEYGDPDNPDDWTFMEGFSPYHNMHADKTYPSVLFTTSTRDDRVHPGHARKMVAKMLEQGHDVRYWENIEGGHGGAADNTQMAYMFALEYAFLSRLLEKNAS
ncbi:MAG: prolyl oligopeptidase family serine peptidase, partial [Actinomycetota bacterium]